MPANWPRTSWRGWRPPSPQRRRHPCRADRPLLASPGPSTFAAATCRTRRWRSASPCSPPRGRICCSSTSASSPMRGRGLSDAARRSARARDARRRDRRARQGRREDRARPGARRRAAADAGDRGNGGTRRCRAPTRPASRAPPRTRPRSTARAPPTAATARRLPSCSAGSTRQKPGTLDEISVVTRLEEARRADRRGDADAAARRLLLHDRRRRPERRDHALPRVARHQPAARRRRALPARFRRAVSGRHDRHHPHRADRHADRRDARALHAGAEGHDRHFDAALSRRARAAPTSTPSRASRCGRPGSTTPMAPATASAPIFPSTRGRSASPAPAPRSCWKA